MLDRHRRGSNAQLPRFDAGRHMTLIVQKHGLPHRGWHQKPAIRRNLEGLRLDIARTGGGRVRGRALLLMPDLPVLVLRVGRIGIAVLRLVARYNLLAGRSPAFLARQLIGDFPNPSGLGAGRRAGVCDGLMSYGICHIFIQIVETFGSL